MIPLPKTISAGTPVPDGYEIVNVKPDGTKVIVRSALLKREAWSAGRSADTSGER